MLSIMGTKYSTMKKILAGIAIMVIAVTTVNAQQADSSLQQQQQRSFRHHGNSRMVAKLHFSDQQKQQLKSINRNYHQQLMDLKKNEDITVREFKSRMSALRTAHRSQLQALLTQEQKNQVAGMKQQRMQMAKVNATARAEKLKIRLSLTDTQASQLKDARTGMVDKIKSIHNDNTLSQDQKREQIRNLVFQQKDQLKSILTAEQLQQLQQMRKDRMQGMHTGK